MMAMSSTTRAETELAETDRTRLRRRSTRGTFARATANAILDEALLANVGFSTGEGPVVLPMTFVRLEHRLYLHGASGNAMLRNLAGDGEVCVNVTILDGLVLARSAFHHSMNFRSVVLFGRAVEVVDDGEKRSAMDALVERMTPGRSAEARPPTDSEMRATLVVALDIDEGSVKIRTGGPVDDPEDMDLDVWAGHIPVTLKRGQPVPDGRPT